MPIRFRRTFTIFPGVKVNVSKGGVSFTVGAKGYHLNFSKRGVKQTVGLPGSGISHSSYLGKNDTKSEKETKHENDTDEKERENAASEDERVRVAPRRKTSGWILLLSLVVIYFGAIILGLIPVNFLSEALHTLTEWARGIGL